MSLQNSGLLKRGGHLTAILFFAIILPSCSTTVEKVLVTPDFRLVSSKNIFVRLANTSGGISVNSTNLASVNTSSSGAILAGAGSTQLLPGEKQAVLAFESLQFELMTMGFGLVDKEEKADYIVDFSIGAVRNDPFAGWIADQAFVKFMSKADNKMLAFYRANIQFITPTVNNIIKSLASAIRADLTK